MPAILPKHTGKTLNMALLWMKVKHGWCIVGSTWYFQFAITIHKQCSLHVVAAGNRQPWHYVPAAIEQQAILYARSKQNKHFDTHLESQTEWPGWVYSATDTLKGFWNLCYDIFKLFFFWLHLLVCLLMRCWPAGRVNVTRSVRK